MQGAGDTRLFLAALCVLGSINGCGTARAEPPSSAPPNADLKPNAETAELRLDVHAFRVIESKSGKVNYYETIDEKDPRDSFIHALYRPPLESVTLGTLIPEALRRKVKRVRWQWRAVAIPAGGDECKDDLGDSAAIIYLTFKRTFKYYTLKYVWSPTLKKGTTCEERRNPFVAQDVIVLQSGGPLNVWRSEDIDPNAEFRAHFADGDPKAEVPDLMGVGLMSDGDQTQQTSSADYRGFTVSYSTAER